MSNDFGLKVPSAYGWCGGAHVVALSQAIGAGFAALLIVNAFPG